MKKFFAVILALAMTFALSATALAAWEPESRALTEEEQQALSFIVDLGPSFTASGNNIMLETGSGFRIVSANHSYNFEGSHSTSELVEAFIANNPTDDDPKFGYKAEAVTGEPTKIKIYPLYEENILSDADKPFFLTGLGGHPYQEHPEDFPLDVVFTAQGGTITVINPQVGGEYKAYKIFDLTYSEQGTSYSISNTSPWWTAVKAYADDTSHHLTLTQSAGDATVYLVEAGKDFSAADFAAALNTALEGMTSKPTPDAWRNAGNAPVGELLLTKDGNEPAYAPTDNVHVDLGYYFVTSEKCGRVCSMDSANPNAVIIEKNESPGPSPNDAKLVGVMGDNNTIDYKPVNNVGIGETVYFRIHEHVPLYDGSHEIKEYTIVDTLGAGFTLNAESIEIYLYPSGTETTGDPRIKLYSPAEDGVTVTTATDATSGVTTITVVLNPREIDGYYPDAHVIIKYNAEVNDKAAYDNVNTVQMTWTYVDGTTPPTPPVDPPHSDTYVYGFTVKKVTGTPAQQISGAEFSLWDAKTGGNQIKLVKVSDGKYRVATPEEAAAENFVSAPIEAGLAEIFGLAPGTYWLQEDVAPEGYNKLTERKEVKIVAQETPAGGIVTDVEVVNNVGEELPSTGGIGTTIFYVVGSLLMVGAAVLLIVRKKMSVME